MFIETTVNRSRTLKCGACGKKLPMKTMAMFELDEDKTFINVFCLKCADEHGMTDVNIEERHPFDLED